MLLLRYKFFVLLCDFTTFAVPNEYRLTWLEKYDIYITFQIQIQNTSIISSLSSSTCECMRSSSLASRTAAPSPKAKVQRVEVWKTLGKMNKPLFACLFDSHL